MIALSAAGCPYELVSAAKADRTAWHACERGQRNVYTAAAPDVRPVRLTRFLADDGIDYPDDVHDSLLHRRWIYTFERMDAFLARHLRGAAKQQARNARARWSHEARRSTRAELGGRHGITRTASWPVHADGEPKVSGPRTGRNRSPLR